MQWHNQVSALNFRSNKHHSEKPHRLQDNPANKKYILNAVDYFTAFNCEGRFTKRSYRIIRHCTEISHVWRIQPKTAVKKAYPRSDSNWVLSECQSEFFPLFSSHTEMRTSWERVIGDSVTTVIRITRIFQFLSTAKDRWWRTNRLYLNRSLFYQSHSP